MSIYSEKCKLIFSKHNSNTQPTCKQKRNTRWSSDDKAQTHFDIPNSFVYKYEIDPEKGKVWGAQSENFSAEDLRHARLHDRSEEADVRIRLYIIQNAGFCTYIICDKMMFENVRFVYSVTEDGTDWTNWQALRI